MSNNDEYQRGYEDGYQARQAEIQEKIEQLRQSWTDGYMARQTELEEVIKKRERQQQANDVPGWFHAIASAVVLVVLVLTWLVLSYGL